MKEYIIAVSVVILLVVLTFVLVIFLPKPETFFCIKDTYPQLLLLEKAEYYNIIKKECTSVSFEEEKKKISSKVIKKDWSECCKDYPMNNSTLKNTFEILSQIDGIVSVKLREILPKVDSFSKKGNPEVNNLVEYCMPITVSRARKGTVWVDGESKYLVEGQGLLYDTSREHAVCNKTREKILLLVLEVKRPSFLPRGIA
jgi:hypothetical protein